MTPTSTHRSAAAAARELRPLVVYLSALVGREPGGLVEVRARHGPGMTQRVYPSPRLGDAAAAIAQLGQRTDVYVGAAPRRRRAGGLDAVERVWVLWVDCDSPQAVEQLGAFAPAPAIVVRSGSGENRHAYWLLQRPIGPEEALVANRRLAHVLRADGGAVTTAAAILRPPGTLNFKHDPPAPVVAERLRPWQRVSARQLVRDLPDPPRSRPESARGREPGPALADDDPLRQVPPVVYVQALTGRAVGRDGKVACPFHALSVGEATADGVSPARSVEDASSSGRGAASDPLLMVPPPVYFERLTGLRVGPSGKLHCLFHDDRSPSLHVYPEPERGWFCFGCRRGGSVYDLAALLFGLGTRGRDFVELRRELERRLLPLRQVSHSTRGWTP